MSQKYRNLVYYGDMRYLNYGYGMPTFGVSSGLFLLVIWSLFWKGLALWHAGRKGQPWWFIALLVINTMGILEIIYLFGILKLRQTELFAKPNN